MINGFDFFLCSFFLFVSLFLFHIISSLPRDEISATDRRGCQRLWYLCSAAAVRYDNDNDNDDDEDVNDDACLRG